MYSMLDNLKTRNEEKRKRKEMKMRKEAGELRQKALSKNLIMTPPKEMSNLYVAKTHVDGVNDKSELINTSKLDYSGLNTRAEYIPSSSKVNYYQPAKIPIIEKKEKSKASSELMSFTEDDNEDVSVAFAELMSEIAKYEVGDNKF